jgi:hypothetical protein
MHWDLIQLYKYHVQVLLYKGIFLYDDVICSIVYDPQTGF